MTVKVTIEFKSVDEAIVALGKLAGAPSAPSKGAAASPQGAVTDAPASRNGRSDKGQTRGKYAPRAEKSEPAGAGGTAEPTGTAPAPQTAPAGEASSPNAAGQVGRSSGGAPNESAASAQPAPAATRADAQAALEALVSGVNLDAGIKLLAEFGTQRLRDLPDAELVEFAKKAKAALPKAPA